ncbi:DUF3043 domain-containing protein [Bailinhaonella thermotolerans]|uniref:DUF3043 domain-containing protein n=1 Tax=Bailinhaonella thermotolerans TaxID=1070861 RepID=A0A3A4B215_9ACTN|nr:DUF3043 domain-containing protein [Bailinhaonella thermotolerans]RJL31440.1 DUF3043 domain-containing protein [Bailinhaonella thermotolerans]
MFRRRSQAPSDEAVTTPAEDQANAQAKKGRPTPKRREAEGRRRQPVAAPKDRKEAYRQLRERQKVERERARQGMLRGEERYLPARDKGPVRKLARDYVDGRRTFGEFFLFISLAILVVAYLPSAAGAAITIVWPLMMLLIIGESIFIARRVKKLAAEKFPGESTKGVGFYAAMRALQIRKLRFPPPAVGPGGKPVPPKK